MDNLTHSLVGVAIADACTQGKFRKIRSPALIVSLIANNFPDLDFLYAKALSGQYGYILHHRGHTHTLIAGLGQALIILLLFWLFQRWRQLSLSKSDWIFLGAMALVGMWTHIALDSLNSYGVHPFWPFSNEWHYQDAVFIVEPWFLLVCGIFLGMSARSRWAKIFLFGVAIMILGLEFALTAAPLLIKMAYVTSALVLLVLAAWCPLPYRALSALGLVIVFALGAGWAARLAKSKIAEAATLLFPQESLDEVAVMPTPGNPFCLEFFTVTLDEKQDLFAIRKGHFAHTLWLPACLTHQKSLQRVREAGSQFSDYENIEWQEEHLSSLQFLRQNADPLRNCHFSAFLRFSRLPFFSLDDTGLMSFGDWRYARRARGSFANFQARIESPCPTLLPPWEPPRARVLLPGLSD